ncbi:MAG: flagellar hook capping FlgD N-terminal domain-containing protein, partial [Deltaproteobacteria bacterium]
GKDDFLKLLVTQLQNQDPMNPTDSTAFVAQLAQFSSLEQLSNVNDNLKVVQLFDQSINNAQAVNFVGKTVKASGSMFELGTGETHEIQYQLGEDADTVYVSIYNSSGEIVKKIEMDKMTAGSQSVVWDGKDENGSAAPAGTYSFSLQAKNKDGEIMESAAFIEEVITGVSYHNGNTYLLAKGIEIPYAAIIEVSEPEKK